MKKLMSPQRLQIGETLFSESFLNGFTGLAVNALDMLLHENTHTTYETNKFSWVLKHENITVLNQMRLLRNRILCIFHFWLLQFSEYAKKGLYKIAAKRCSGAWRRFSSSSQ